MGNTPQPGTNHSSELHGHAILRVDVCFVSCDMVMCQSNTSLAYSSTSLHWLGLKQGVFACVGWQVTLCDPIWQATPCSSEMFTLRT